MDFQPPDSADLANVHALNSAFIDCAIRRSLPQSALQTLPAGLAEMLLKCNAESKQRLCRSPFMIFSLAERDALRWQRLFERSGTSGPDLLDAIPRPHGPSARVVSAALAFIWQLVRRRPYAARVVSGAPLAWCDRLAERTLIDVIQFAATETDLLTFRMPGNKAFWQRMLIAGTSAEKEIRRAARVSSLQSILTECYADRYRRLPAAACSMPMLSVAEKSTVSKSRTRGYNTPPDDSTPDNEPHQNLRKR